MIKASNGSVNLSLVPSWTKNGKPGLVQPLTNTNLSPAPSHGSTLRVAYQGVPGAYSEAVAGKLTRTLKLSRVINSTSRFRRWSSGSRIVPSSRWRILSEVRFTETMISSSVTVSTSSVRFRSLSTTASSLSPESVQTVYMRDFASPSSGSDRRIAQQTIF
ncbi:unnamed protein product [Brassica napus]|uniref:(rape) hypothetical protein n=1 Tax=Brassica napus TaxID=3708 RepID=A0A816X2R2_BRANA|nr:unnamed protein product [Brassica napus]